MKLLKKVSIIAFFVFALMFSAVVRADADKAQLIIARDEINQAITDQTNDLYQAASYTAFSDGLNALGGVAAVDVMIADNLALQVDVDQMTQDLNNLLDGLVTTLTYNTVFVEYFQESNRDTTPYTLRSIAVYDAELNRIKDIIDEPTSGEVLIQSLSADITASSSLLVLLGDKTDLQARYDFAEAVLLDGSNYIPSTYSLFQTDYSSIDATLLINIGFTKLEVINNSDASLPEVQSALNEIESSLSLLILKPDKTALIQAYNDAVALDKSIYTLDSRTLFIAGLIPINQTILDLEARDDDVLQATTDLNELYNLLVLRGDYSSLQTSIDDLVDFNYDLYTPTSVVMFDEEISRISSEMVDENATAQDIEELVQNYEDAFDLLILRADKTDLILYNNQAIIAYYEEKNLYTDSSYALFKAAVMDYGTYLLVNQVIDNLDSLQSEVDLLSQKISDALDLLDPLVDNAEILSLYENVGIIATTLYTPESVEVFNEEYNRIYNVIIGKELSQTVYNQTTLELEDLQELLVLRADLSELITLHDSLLSKNEETYSISSFAYFSTVMSQCSVLISNLNVSQAEVDAAVVLLTHATSLLEQKAGIISIKTNDPALDINDYVTVGNATIVSYVSSDTSVLHVDSTGKVLGVAFGEAKVYIRLSNGVVETLNFLVKANVKPVTLVLAISLPVLSVSLGVGMLFMKKDYWKVFKKLIFWKKKA
ncbi:MAG: hypothetical protein KKE16_05775 [Firmicutes bacterium]|nr:hypothetical protein [Bacillota bacterium]